VLIMDAIVETYDAVDFAQWPTAVPRADRLLALSGQMSLLEVGTAMAVLTSYNHDDSDGSAPDTEAGIRRIQNLLGVDLVTAPGGILLQDTTTGVVIAPGCCFGLENWRDWLDLINGEELWLGHGTAPRTSNTRERSSRCGLTQTHQQRSPSSFSWPSCQTSSKPCTTSSTVSWPSPNNGLPATRPRWPPP
jgi:hypothetical protein